MADVGPQVSRPRIWAPSAPRPHLRSYPPRGGRRAGPWRLSPSSPPGEDEEFILKLINRPILVLRGLDGFVCQRRGSNQLDTNRSVYDVFHLGFSDGAYQIRGARGRARGRSPAGAGAGQGPLWGGGGRGPRLPRAPRRPGPRPQAAAAGSGTRAATAACTATASAPRTSSSSSASAAAWPSAPGAASTCAGAPRGCCARTRTRRPGSRSGSTERGRVPPIKPCLGRSGWRAPWRREGRVVRGRPAPAPGLRPRLLHLPTPQRSRRRAGACGPEWGPAGGTPLPRQMPPAECGVRPVAGSCG